MRTRNREYTFVPAFDRLDSPGKTPSSWGLGAANFKMQVVGRMQVFTESPP